MGAVDPTIQVMSGLVHQNQAFAGHPTLAGIFIADFVSSLYATISILAALNWDEGTYIDLSMMDALISLFHSEVGEYSATETAPPRQRNTSVPQGLYETSDGFVCLLVRGGEDVWLSFCEIMGFDDWVESGELNTLDDRQEKDSKEEINNRIQDTLIEEPTKKWVETFENEDVYLVPVRSVDEVFEDEATHQRGVLRESENEALGTYNWLDFPAIFSNYETSDASAPRLGEHSGEILSRLGYSEKEIQELCDNNVTKSFEVYK
jgi:crotonobetainyl-CoA:carnitine CoA-transferase CaiB-like acyl-CoA transferase